MEKAQNQKLNNPKAFLLGPLLCKRFSKVFTEDIKSKNHDVEHLEKIISEQKDKNIHKFIKNVNKANHVQHK